MYKIKRIKFINHDILGDLELNFCDRFGHAVDTVIIAGENGTGKSTVLDSIFRMSNKEIQSPVEFELENGKETRKISYHCENGHVYIHEGEKISFMILPSDSYDFKAIYSSVAIIFNSTKIDAVKSSSLDEKSESRISNEKLSIEIKQLLVDIQSQDDSEGMLQIKNHAIESYANLVASGKIKPKMQRFTNAFDKMFDNIRYIGVSTINGQKKIIFHKCGQDIDIDQLSSGEKQVVYRGCFLLKDANALKGAFVLIDEPEISMHPAWQMKIMDYYKDIFTNSMGEQTSQIFAVTHSPFIIHNNNRKNDKVLVLARDEFGKIIVKDRPEYYECSSSVLVQDAFSISEFSQEKSRVYLEGRTDEMYFNKALDVYKLDVSFQFKWIGYLDKRGQERNTGKDSLNKAVEFLRGQNLQKKMVCLYDSDCNITSENYGNVYVRSLKRQNNVAGINAGIENILVLGGINVQSFKKKKERIDDYGCRKVDEEFQKMKFCNYICSLSHEKLEGILVHVKEEIQELQKILE